jgi:uncharacterized protein (DUF362 family)
MHRVGLARAEQSYQAVKSALNLIRQDVRVPTDRPVLIKPNMVMRNVELCATPVGAVYATLEFLSHLGVEHFILAEGTGDAEGDTLAAFREYGYFSLAERFKIEFCNLHDDEKVLLEGLDANLQPVRVRLARRLFTSYVVSIARMKTHLRVVATLTIKNIVVAAIHNPDRYSPAWHAPDATRFSHEPRPINLSLAKLARVLPIHLAIVDGVVGMEGNGPVKGTPVRSGVALAGTDALAVDLVGADLMGFDSRTIGYLWYLSQIRGMSRENALVVGEDPANCVTHYKPSENMQEILAWWIPDWKSHVETKASADEVLFQSQNTPGSGACLLDEKSALSGNSHQTI